MQTPLRRENRRPIGRERFGAAQRVGSLTEARQQGQRFAEADQRVDVLRLRRDNRLIDVGRPLGMSHLRVQPRNPQPRVDVVGVERRERLKLFQRFRVRSRSREAFRFGALIRRLRLRRGEQHDAENAG